MEQSKPLELPKEWKEKIINDARFVSEHDPNSRNDLYKSGVYIGYVIGATSRGEWLYACQINYAALREKCDRYEAALKEIIAMDGHKHGKYDINNVANEALSAGEGENEL